MHTEWGPLAKFMYAREARAHCEYVSWKDYYYNESEESWRSVEMNSSGGSWWSTRGITDHVRTSDVRIDENLRTFQNDSDTFVRRYKTGHCGKRSCYACQKPRMNRWKKRINQRIAQTDSKLWFVTLTLPGDSDGRREWNTNLNEAYFELNNWWRLSRVKHNVGKARGKPYVNSTSNCVRVFEIPEAVGGTWNPHVHVLTESNRSMNTVRNHWREIWQKDGVRPRLQVKPVISENELADYVTKVTKYLTKGTPGNQELDTVMFRKHNVSFCGDWRHAYTIKEDEEE